jgi:hypothetical protein
MNISVWKLSAKDGKGAWFARRSVHKGMGFERWKEGLEREFEQTLGVEADNPDDQLEGKIRGIGAERRVEDVVVDGVARLQGEFNRTGLGANHRSSGYANINPVYQLSVRFPGPTTPRDFVTLLVTSTPELQEDHKGKGRKPRQMVVISKPCIHPECPERNGFIRGQYESVEVVREVPVDKSMRKVHSSLDLGGDEFARPPVDGQAVLNTAAKKAEANGDAGAKASFERQAKSDIGAQDVEDEQEYAIEWLMITRSDPGGSVPRFMVEKGTPPGICNDAGRFVKWLSSEDFSKPAGSESDSAPKEVDMGAGTATATTTDKKDMATSPPQRKSTQIDPKLQSIPEVKTPGVEHTGEPTSGGFYGMIANALEAAGSVVTSALPAGLTGAGSNQVSDSEDDITSEESDTTSSDAASFTSAKSGGVAVRLPADHDQHIDSYTASVATNNDATSPDHNAAGFSSRSVRSTTISETSESPSLATAPRHDKELRKLEDRRRKAEEKWAKLQERALAKSGGPEQSAKEKEKEEAALAKLKEKHDKEIAKQEEKYQKEVKKLEEQRAKEERKAEERRRKAMEKEAKENIQAELERTRAERDVLVKQVDLLKGQIGELQTQNTMLVAKLGKVSLDEVRDVEKAVSE